MNFFQTFSIIKPHEKEKREKQSGEGVGVGQLGLREGERRLIAP